MHILDLIHRTPAPEPWAEGDNIPWNDPAFSERMLKEHLSQEHDLASRRAETIDAHVAWIHSAVLGGKPSRILDLGCGPGLYSVRLARKGHSLVGVDYAPAAVAYAREQAQGLDCMFTQADIREADYGSGYDLAMQIFGEINVFKPADARLILNKARAALKPGGRLLLEAAYYDLAVAVGKEANTWFAAQGGLFSARPHLGLEEHFWNHAQEAATTRYYIVDAETGEVTRYAQSMQAYREEDYRKLFDECGFELEVLPGMAMKPDDTPYLEYCALLGRVKG